MTAEATSNGEATATDPVFGPDAPLLSRSWKRWVPIVLVLALGVALRAAQYFGQVDMWYDELAIARNIEDRGMLEHLRPLDHFQVAPLGFLVMVDATTAVLGVTVAGRRLAPWLFGLASLLLFWRVAERFAEGSSLLAVLTLFAVSPALISYGQSVKPYIGDVAITLALVWLSLRYLEGREDTRGALDGGRAGIEEWIQGERHYDDPRGYLREVDALRGSPRAWFFWVNQDGGPHPAWIREYLGTIGEERDRIPTISPERRARSSTIFPIASD